MKRLVPLSAVCLGFVFAVPPLAMAADASVSASGSSAAVQVARGLRYAPKTVAIPRAVVKANLIGIAPGGVFKFRRAAGPLGRLKVGSVMLLQGSAAGIVTALHAKHGQLIVKTRDAPLAAIVKSG